MPPVARLRPLALAACCLTLATALAASSGAARPSPGPTVALQPNVGLAPDGGFVGVQVIASCPDRWTLVEGVVRAAQPGASGQASFPLACTGSLQVVNVTVPATTGAFVLGTVQLSASVVVQRGRTQSAQDADTIELQPLVAASLAATGRLDGGDVLVDVTTACPVGATGRTSSLGVTQGLLTGVGSYLVVCDGRSHTTTVRVPGGFTAGAARALTFASVEYDDLTFTGVADSPLEIVG